MGILVPEASLPNGITVNNVYMSFASEVIYIHPRNADGSRHVTSNYRIFRDYTKTPYSDMRFPISVTVTSDPYENVHDLLYSELRQMYPGSEDSLVNSTPSIPPVPAPVPAPAPTSNVISE